VHLFTARDYELQRTQINLGEIIGEGQFGDVHKGVYKGRDGKAQVAVAVKTCKSDADLATAEKFLEEACKLLMTFHCSACFTLVSV
jgi:focal adhesion kinase 1